MGRLRRRMMASYEERSLAENLDRASEALTKAGQACASLQRSTETGSQERHRVRETERQLRQIVAMLRRLPRITPIGTEEDVDLIPEEQKRVPEARTVEIPEEEVEFKDGLR